MNDNKLVNLTGKPRSNKKGKTMQRSVSIILVQLTVLLFSPSFVSATTYYVSSSDGNDTNDGTAPEQAWKSLKKVNEMTFKPSDKILFVANTYYPGQLKPQGSGALVDGKPSPIVIGMYGKGKKPCIDAHGEYQSALYLYNVEYWEVNKLEITNKGPERKANRMGVYVHIKDFGTAHHIYLKNLYVNDINGSLIKNIAGHGIAWRNEGEKKMSRFDGLLIEGCHLVRCERNGIMGFGYWKRDESWYPSLNMIIRNNLLEQVPGDGIVPIGCDGALVEHNVMRNCTRRLPDGQAAAGIWTWGCDNTIIQFNEVSDHKAPWDGQGFDSDWDCRNTIIQYNYSHDNEGGFLLICNKGNAEESIAINTGTIIRYNISVNDGLRAAGKHAGFSPCFHISGPVENTKIYNNIIYVPEKPDSKIDKTMIKMDNWGGPWPENTYFANNIFYVDGSTNYDWGQSINHIFENNLYYGKHENAPKDVNAVTADPLFLSPRSAKAGFETLRGFMLKKGSPCIGRAAPIENNGGRDLWGNTITKQGPRNIGAYE
jgi:hypothetical protein